MSNLPIRPINNEQKAFVIEHLAKYTEYEVIKQKFQLLFETGIEGEEIIRIKAKYSDMVENIRAQLLDPRGARLAHARTRLDELEEALKDAKTLRSIGPAVRIGEFEWAPGEKGMNVQGIINVCKAAREEEYMAKKFYLDIIKTKLDQAKEELLESGFSSGEITVNTGIEEDEDDNNNTQ